MFRHELNPQVERALARKAQLLRDDADALQILARAAFARAVTNSGDLVRIQRHFVRELHIAGKISAQFACTRY